MGSKPSQFEIPFRSCELIVECYRRQDYQDKKCKPYDAAAFVAKGTRERRAQKFNASRDCARVNNIRDVIPFPRTPKHLEF